jgi:predicted ATPase
MNEVQKTAQDTNVTVKKLAYDQEHQATIDWLTLVNYASQQSDFIARRQEGTGQWLLQSNEFQQWLAQRNKTLFCPGIPGAGKTIITSIVVHHLHSIFGNDPSIGIAYLYCNVRQQHEQKCSDLIVSLLKQLVREQPSIPNVVKGLYRHHKPKGTRPLPDEILGALHSVTASFSRTFIIIDALDECQVSHEGRGMLLRQIFNIQARAGVNIFATSRFIPEIDAMFNKSIRLEIRASDTDVQKYLDGRLQNFQSAKDLFLQAEIKSTIAKAVDGMYVLCTTLGG